MILKKKTLCECNMFIIVSIVLWLDTRGETRSGCHNFQTLLPSLFLANFQSFFYIFWLLNVFSYYFIKVWYGKNNNKHAFKELEKHLKNYDYLTKLIWLSQLNEQLVTLIFCIAQCLRRAKFC